ncbi:type II toxin-antitoxin system RelE/ParE family toxin [Sinomonas halotolerans]|uniref:Type II toxin-antitoxin system RelE/ParE family toxin n=1 Tax=Sinomonas halotolerans TaxID=1644133 RepID=A0ABU9X0N7_9MICC
MSRYTVRFSPAAKRALTEGLPEAVAAAAFELITGALSENPHRLGKQLAEPLFPLYSARRGTYRVIYRLDDSRRELEVVAVTHRKDAYRA